VSRAALVLVATPIGNLGDLSPRALQELSDADVICCEDSRRTGKLLELAGVRDRPKLLVVNDHNEAGRSTDVVERLDGGERVVVVSDAGVPGISDPGERLVAAAVRAGHEVVVVPGPSAGISALVGSGLPTGRHVFEGFLPRKGRARSERLAELAAEARTVVLYESPHRLAATLGDLAVAFGSSRRVAVAREITKLHEEFWRGPLEEAAEWAGANKPKGEIVIVLDGAPKPPAATDSQLVEALTAALGAGQTKRDAAAEVATRFSVSKRRAYALATALG
jgi:16S rRNA (cytidine1402-2'-O)-methyltransferase